MEIQQYNLENDHGMKVKVINYGGHITSIVVPDRYGNFHDVVLGFDHVKDYREQPHPYFGSIIGRFANRIAKGKFSLDGKEYRLAINNGPNALHGGLQGFDKRFWTAEEFHQQKSLKLSYLSLDGEEGYPGNLRVQVTYTLTQQNELKILYEAHTDKLTPVNLTNHTYFNLSSDQDSILNHELMINADQIIAVDQDLTPTGEFKDIRGTEMDFTLFKRIGKDIQKVQEGGGHDHNYVLRDPAKLKFAAALYEPKSGRCMEVFTTEPGLQFYSGNFLDASVRGKNQKLYQKNDGLCLETQHFPDSPNHPEFPSTILRPQDKYLSETVYRFSVK